MKKIILGSASAIIAILSSSAFKSAQSSATTYYWFQIKNGGTPIGHNVVLNNSNATFVQQSTTLLTADSPCNEVKVTQCVVGFTSAQIFTTTNNHKVLKTHGVYPATSDNSQTSKTARTSYGYVANYQ